MTNTPLNPDAVTVVARALNEAGWTCYEGGMEPGNYDKCEDCQEVCDKIARKALAALSATQPVVNSVEELDALPLGTVIQDSDDGCILQALERGSIMGTEWYVPGVEEIYTSASVELPARVLYRPGDKP